MRLLISVAGDLDARAALDGGADIIDAKDPGSGALGAVSPEAFNRICAAVGAARPVTAALGDAHDEAAVEDAARTVAEAGAWLVKVGFAGVERPDRACALARAAVRGAKNRDGSGVIIAAYADAPSAWLSPAELLEVASEVGAAGVLLDTADKSGPRLLNLVSPDWLAHWAERAHRTHLLTAVAGRLHADDLSAVRQAGADIAGVRGAACDGGRQGRVSASKVRLLLRSCGAAVEDVA